MTRIVVGVDGSANAQAALRWAVAEAALRGAMVDAVLAWQAPTSLLLGSSGQADFTALVEELEGQARQTLDRTVGSLGATGDVTVNQILLEARPDKALLEIARHADLLVVGSRGLSGMRRALGSVSSRCVAHSRCPVAVINARGTDTNRADDATSEFASGASSRP